MLASPDLYVSEFKLKPEVPIQGERVGVRIGVYNKGKKRAGAFTVQWWAGENYREPAHEWRIGSMAARGGRILTYTYEGYPSWYGRLITKVVIDPFNEVRESDEENNIFKTQISVRKQAATRVTLPPVGPLQQARSVDLRCRITDKELKVAYFKDFRWRIKFKVKVTGEGFRETLRDVYVRYALYKSAGSNRYERSYRIGSLSPGEEHSHSVDLKCGDDGSKRRRPRLEEGRYYIRVEVDPGDNHRDRNRANNMDSWHFTLRK
ncbi:MAG: CARDB domain-containing protein [Candidatus Aminicenantia bacterium]